MPTIGGAAGPDAPPRAVWRLPNGRYVFAGVDGRYYVQPPNDNWRHSAATLDEAVAWWDRYRRRLAGEIES